MSLYYENSPRQPKIVAIFLLIIVAVFLVICLVPSCTCESKLARIKKNCPELLVKDTLRFKDTIYTQKVTKDTLFKFSHTRSDTVIVKEGQMTVKYFYNTKDSTIYLSGKCDTIRIIKEYNMPYEKIVYKETFFSFLKEYWWVFLILIALGFVYKFFKK